MSTRVLSAREIEDSNQIGNKALLVGGLAGIVLSVSLPFHPINGNSKEILDYFVQYVGTPLCSAILADIGTRLIYENARYFAPRKSSSRL